MRVVRHHNFHPDFYEKDLINKQYIGSTVQHTVQTLKCNDIKQPSYITAAKKYEKEAFFVCKFSSMYVFFFYFTTYQLLMH